MLCPRTLRRPARGHPPAPRGGRPGERMDARRTKADLLRELASVRDELAKARKEARSAAAGAEGAATYRSLLETIRAFLVELDDEGRVLYASPTITEILGYTPEEYVGRGGFDIVHEDERAELFERFRKLMVTGQAGGVIFRDGHRDGRAVGMASSGGAY